VVKQVVYTKAARRTLGRLPQNTAQRISQKILAYAADPSSQANNVKALQGSGLVRLRVGDWRVIMDDGVVLEILDIGSRGGIYG
jgi:mRNA interferase RelE/StbE